MTQTKKTCMLMILDGWGIGTGDKGDAVSSANTPFLDSLEKDYPHTQLTCSGEAVGLPEGIMGNSEVGHLNIGAGRVVYQDLLRIDMAIKDSSFKSNKTINNIISTVKENNTSLHLMGLISDGGVHSQLNHLLALLDMAKEKGLEKVYIHAILDGRDTSPTGGADYIKKVDEHTVKNKIGAVATVCGRYYAMDRDKRWDRIEKAYNLYILGQGSPEQDPVQAVKNAYERGETDEFIKPIVINDSNSKPKALIQDGDGVFFFNFRADRAREISMALTDPEFNHFDRKKIPEIRIYGTMTRYDEHFSFPTAFPPVHMQDILGELVSKQGLCQLRIAETEKYAHVTYFFNGGEEAPFPMEDRCLIPSPRDVATYDQKPEMSAVQVTKEVMERIKSGKYDMIVLNFANMDMVGHTGIIEAAVRACETIDKCVEKIVTQIKAAGGTILITADHGNAEMMIDQAGNIHTAHTLNPVRFILVNDNLKNVLLDKGKLCDIAPTILEIMAIEKSEHMTGKSLIKSDLLIDYITGSVIPDLGAEANRQKIEHFLIDQQGFDRKDIDVNTCIEFEINGEIYTSRIDLVIRVNGKRFMCIKCAPGSLGSREREILAASRLLDTFQIPFSAVSDGETSIVFNTVTGKKIGDGMKAIPTKDEAVEQMSGLPLFPISDERRIKEQLIFRSYDSMNVNRSL
ncbi:Phosphoglycerate mutase [Desulfonema limicola]|uniref:2,3-bisphosphoglycerate-independent phosphoglycerate mutase n=1 Tax=Desulfonema limicola TaxID=45656 RepID=A0A975B6A9_9BACT|nr:2,3-bisphosphoglycerate-independent phosphoglycerate mutase [Desulfonema limicola]QTA79624.1 Phosphoglycerate mutase [Desulfonema limicola]